MAYLKNGPDPGRALLADDKRSTPRSSTRAGRPGGTAHSRQRRNPASYTASQAKNEFGRVLELVIQGIPVVITRHNAPKAILISIDQYNALSRTAARHLENLTGEFDALLERMQTPKARAAMKAAFGASPKQLGRAAVAAARKRG